MKGLLAGTVLVEAFYPLLDDLCVAFNLLGESRNDHAVGTSEYMAEQHDPRVTQRLWWTSHNRHGERIWVSINPGEYRKTPPDPPCIVKDLPPTVPETSSREMLALALQSTNLMPPILSGEHRITTAAQRLLSRDDKGATSELADACRRALTFTDMPSYEAAVHNLYDRFVQDMAWTAADFTALVLLVQIQAGLDIRITQDWSSNPPAFLAALIRMLVQDKDSSAEALELLGEIAASEFDSGRTEVRNALHGSMADMGRTLMLAWHRFFLAHMILTALVDAGVPEAELPVPLNLPDEAAACTFTGIQVRARFALRHPEAEALDLAVGGGSTFAELRREAIKSASEIVPAYTRFFSEILAAQALGMAPAPQSKRQALDELERLRRATAPGQDLEADWIDHAQMNILRSLGETTRANAMATSLAGKMVVRRVLGGGD